MNTYVYGELQSVSLWVARLNRVLGWSSIIHPLQFRHPFPRGGGTR